MIAPELKFEREPLKETKTIKEAWQDEATAKVVKELTDNEARKVLAGMFRTYAAYAVASDIAYRYKDDECIDNPNYDIGNTLKSLVNAYKYMYGGDEKSICRGIISVLFGEDMLALISKEGEWCGR